MYISVSWRMAGVAFLSEIVKTGHLYTENYRQISLSSFLPKLLARLLDVHIKPSVVDGLLLKAQQSYTNGKSVGTLLHNVVYKLSLENISPFFWSFSLSNLERLTTPLNIP